MIILFFLLLSLLLAEASSRAQDKVMAGESWDSGIIDLYDSAGPGNADMFYILIRCRRHYSTPPPLLMWIQGGPGCSSLLGLFMENGPYLFALNSTYFRNPYSWNEVADTLYVDQPPGVGFSHVSSDSRLCVNLTCVGKYMYDFFLRFVQRYPEYQGRPIYVAGQSYAGQYIPGIGGYLARAHNPLINIKGIAIGNGIVNLGLQVGTYPIFGYENSKYTNYTFSKFLRTQTHSWLCQSALKLHIEPLFYFCNQAYLEIRYNLANSNDIRAKYGYRQPGYIDRYLADPNITAQLGTDRKYAMCNTRLNDTMYHMYYDYTLDDLTDALENGVNVLMYYGDKDAVCNWRGGENVAHNVPWKGKQQYQKAEYGDWVEDGKTYGRIKRHKNLAFLRLFDSGHYVPVDQPFFALRMMEKFTHNWDEA